ncbi:hypothetical protein [Actinoplanes flavus]|uniref:WXG100 family type VII secretion target n=1 Tax=Actinoplanes flavus TaxID=2820290 RepID=A0ABS3UDU0_9ACTN|nr:hypothetical protein [Actinoplanes flavus]MBO3736945.1 hypothetical protein [Actinoplanes flavus]
MTAPGAGAFEQDFYDATQAISRGVQEIQDNFRLLEERLNRALTFIYVPMISEGIIAAFQKLTEATDKFFNLLQRFITEPGYPPALFRVGELWETEVGQKLSDQAARMAPNSRAADDSFVGSAARAYKDAAEAQRLATQSFMPLSTSVKSALHELGHSQIVFLIAIGAAAATFVVGLVAAVAAAGTGVGAPAAGPIAISAAAGAVTMLLTAAPIIYDAYSRFKTAINTMESELRDSEGMPSEGDPPVSRWPRVGERITDNPRPWQVATD